MKSFDLTKKLFITLLTVVVVFTSCNNNIDDEIIPQTKSLNEKIQELTDSIYTSYLANNAGFPGGFAIRVIHGDESGFGHDGFDDNFSESVHFRGQSTTKSFTAAGIILLFQRGMLQLDALVTDTIPGKEITYLPGTEDYNIPYKNQITLFQLLHHTAGVYDLVNHPEGEHFVDSVFSQDPEFTMTIDLMTSYISSNQLYEFEPGESWTYSNSGFQLLAKIIERVSDKSYQQFITDEFVNPLKLNETSFPDKGYEQTLPEPYVDSWIWVSGESYNLTEQNMSANIGEGNMITSPRDLCKFYDLLLKGEAGIDISYVSNYIMNCVPASPTSSTGYGTGLFHYVNLGYGHGGDGSGISVKCYTDQTNEFTVFVLTNCWNFKNGFDDMGPATEEAMMLHNLMFEVKEFVVGKY